MCDDNIVKNMYKWYKSFKVGGKANKREIQSRRPISTSTEQNGNKIKELTLNQEILPLEHQKEI